MTGNNLERLFQKQVNVYRLQELTDSMVTGACSAGSRFAFTENMVKQLHGVAMHKLLQTPGEYRQSAVHLTNSPHVPPAWFEVAGHMSGLFEYVNANWETADLVHLSSYVLWRLNWVHPFPNGNGRTSRSAAYMVMQVKHGRLLPSKNSIIAQIVADRAPYYAALRHADDVMKDTSDVREALRPMEGIMGNMLKEQIKANL
ncbi:Fic family protein [Sphingomonas sp. CFBP 8764]|uniref:Fic family protein n=1 Tax=Sphingomonas sp. CFBP 8764 TaxID=2775275 RepID=UPI00177B8982|nr:Fic family protein [Sphingomonas sp. CFBP 8764]MBD8549458.1 Fic family protein [Sphingomonas sp. CFBP 8764]